MIEQSVMRNYVKSLGLSPDDSALEKVQTYLDLLFEYNRNVNLVGTKIREEILTRHFFDCLSIFVYLNRKNTKIIKTDKVLDIGTGAGLPGILLAIFLSNSQIFLLDSKNKAVNFLKIVINAIKLDNVEILSGRAEEIAHAAEYREKFDIVVSRAFAKTSILTEIAVPFCKVGGRTIMYKSKNLQEELYSAEEIINIVGAKIEDIVEVTVPRLDEYRALLVLKKIIPTIYKYPRKYGKIITEPINT